MSEPIVEPNRSDGHLGQRDLEVLAFSTEMLVEVVGAQQHLASCTLCQARVEAERRQRAAFLESRPPRVFVANVMERAEATRWQWPSWRRLVPLVAGAAAAFIVGVVAFTPKTPDIQLKGEVSVALELAVSRHGEVATPLEPGQSLRAGDVVRFIVSAPSPGYAAVVNVDRDGTVTTYVHPTPVTHGARQLLPGSIVLDDVEGEERVFLVFSETPLETSAVERALRDAFGRAGGVHAIGTIELPAQVRSVLVLKERR